MKHTRVKDLTLSERQRLNVACHLLLDADMVSLNLRPLKDGTRVSSSLDFVKLTLMFQACF